MNKKIGMHRLAAATIALLLFPHIVFASQISTSGGVFNASTRYATPETEPAKAFDTDTETYWSSNRAANNEWLEVALASPATVRSIRLMHDSPTVTLNGRLEGSNDQETWTNLGSFSQNPTLTWVTENFENSTQYSFYRLYFTTGDASDNWVRIQEWELYDNTGGTVPVPEFTQMGLILIMGLSVVFIGSQINKRSSLFTA